MNLVRQAQAMKEERLNMMSKVMEQKQEAELFPLRIQEVQQGLKLKALQADVENFKREQFVGMAEAESAIAAATKAVPTSDPKWEYNIADVIQKHPQAVRSQLLPELFRQFRASMAAKATVDRAQIMAESKAEVAAETAKSKLDLAELQGQLRLKNTALVNAGKLQVANKQLQGALDRVVMRVANNKWANHLRMAEYKNMAAAMLKDPEFMAQPLNVQQKRLNDMGQAFEKVMEERTTKEQSQPGETDLGESTPTADSPTIPVPPPASGKTMTQAIALDYLKKAGGDKAKARALAKQDGFEW